MKQKLYSIAFWIVAVLFFAACSDDEKRDDTGAGDDAITLSAALTRANGDEYPNLHLLARRADNQDVYIAETAITCPAGLYEDTPNDIIFPGGSPYYPLGSKEIRFFAYSGTLTNGRIPLTSGTVLDNDYLISNYGERTSTPGTLSTEGEGTPGSSADPAAILQFRHIMSRVEVIVEIDSTETPPVNKEPATVELAIAGVARTGFYPLERTAPVDGSETVADGAEDASGNYTLQKGINYVVPNGLDLDGATITSLRIDDFRATDEDLTNLGIVYKGTETSSLLLPGYAYTLRIVISRLGVVSVELKQVLWDARGITNEKITYEPYLLELSLGDYENTGNDQIVKAVIYTTDGYMYTGQTDGTTDLLRFVTLPETGMIESVSLFTPLGLLATMETDDYTYNPTGNSVLDLFLSRGGMRLENPAQPNSPSNPYQIYTPVQVFNIRKQQDDSFRLMNDLDIDRLTYSEVNALTPIPEFNGHFFGDGYRINNLIMTGSGLIQLNTGTIENIHLGAGRINGTGENIVGALCTVNAGTIVGCINEARITNAENIAGGICGQNSGRIIGCLNTGDILNGQILGGICGENLSTASQAFVACVNTGMLYRTAGTLGGIIGTSSNSTGADIVIFDSFWLVGTAAEVFGAPEVAVGAGNVIMEDVATLSPEKLRYNLNGSDDDVDATIQNLNDALALTTYGSNYHFVVDQELTGIVWLAPVLK